MCDVSIRSMLLVGQKKGDGCVAMLHERRGNKHVLLPLMVMSTYLRPITGLHLLLPRSLPYVQSGRGVVYQRIIGESYHSMILRSSRFDEFPTPLSEGLQRSTGTEQMAQMNTPVSPFCLHPISIVPNLTPILRNSNYVTYTNHCGT